MMGALTDRYLTGGQYTLETPHDIGTYDSLADAREALADYWSRLGQCDQVCFITTPRGTRRAYSDGEVPHIR